MQGMPQIGEVVDEMYEIRKQLGAGGFGAVYLARHLAMDRDVALKMLVAHGPRPEEMIERFKREVMAIRVLSHPNTVRIFDYRDSASGLLYYTMEHLRGETLKDLTKREGPQSPKRVHHICRQVLKSLSEAHSYGIVHRDLKPANIMLVHMHGEVDFVKVLDFGIAKILDQNEGAEDEDDPLTSAGMLVGTLRYMAPEQITGGQLGPHTDLYSMALIMVELLSGQSVFAGTGRWEVFQKQISEDSIELTAEIMRSALGGVLMRALQKRPENRFKSAEEMLKALDAIPSNLLTEQPLSAGDGPSYEIGAMSSSGSFAPNSGVFGSSAATPAPSSPRIPEREYVGEYVEDDGATIVTDISAISGAGHISGPVAFAPQPQHTAPMHRVEAPQQPASPQLHQSGPQPLASPPPQTAPITAITHIDSISSPPKQPAPTFEPIEPLEPAPSSGSKGALIGAVVVGALLIGGAIVGAVMLTSPKPEAPSQEQATLSPTTAPVPATPEVTPPPKEEPTPEPDEPPAQPPESVWKRAVKISAPDGLKADVYKGEVKIGTTPMPYDYTEETTLTLKAEGYEPQTLMLKEDSEDLLEVALTKLPEPKEDDAKAAPPKDEPKARPSSKPKDEPKTKPPKDEPSSDPSWVDISKPKPKKPKKKPEVPIFN